MYNTKFRLNTGRKTGCVLSERQNKYAQLDLQQFKE